MQFSRRTKRERALIVAGGVLVAVGVFMLLGRYSAIWLKLVVGMRSVSRVVLPLLFVIAGAYVLYGVKTNRFASRSFPWGAAGRSFALSDNDRRIAGVCGGIAQYFGVESSLVRVFIVLLGLASPLFTLVGYGVLALIMSTR